jgi:hypothetical protein
VLSSPGQTDTASKVKVNHCTSARKAIVFYRKATWNTQDELKIAHSVTRYPETWAKGCAYLNWIAKSWRRNAHSLNKYLERLSIPTVAICHVFGKYCTQALAVSGCESGHSIHAHNGQYLGLFQMGSSERRLYGHGDTALEQSYAAFRYFVASGRDWSPWSCQPW